MDRDSIRKFVFDWVVEDNYLRNSLAIARRVQGCD